MLTVTSEDVCWSIRNVKFDIIKVSYTMRLLFLMFVTAVCVLFLLASIYLFESFTWIPIQILYAHGHFKDTQYETTRFNSHTELGPPVLWDNCTVFMIISTLHYVLSVMTWSRKGTNPSWSFVSYIGALPSNKIFRNLQQIFGTM